MAKSIFGKFRKLEKKKKLQLVIAVSISVVLLVALPVYAWLLLATQNPKNAKMRNNSELA